MKTFCGADAVLYLVIRGSCYGWIRVLILVSVFIFLAGFDINFGFFRGVRWSIMEAFVKCVAATNSDGWVCDMRSGR